jgi:hypothetical protein
MLLLVLAKITKARSVRAKSKILAGDASNIDETHSADTGINV